MRWPKTRGAEDRPINDGFPVSGRDSGMRLAKLARAETSVVWLLPRSSGVSPGPCCKCEGALAEESNTTIVSPVVAENNPPDPYRAIVAAIDPLNEKGTIEVVGGREGCWAVEVELVEVGYRFSSPFVIKRGSGGEEILFEALAV